MDFKKLLPHLIAAFALLAVSMVFYAPNAFEGKVLYQSDNDKARGIQTEVQQYLKTEGATPLWTNSQFGGMPTYQVYSRLETDPIRPLARVPFLYQDISKVWAQTFAAMLMMYLFLIVLRLDWRIALFGSFAYGITTYNVDILEAGHTTKMMALAYMPGIFAALMLLMRGNRLLGGGLLALLMAMQLYVNHVQITYYTLLLIGIYFVAELIYTLLKKGDIKNWLVAAGITAAALGLGFGTGAARLLTTWEYGKETIRGKSELSEKASKGDGLDKDYLFGWSYGIAESMTLLVPHAYGGGANEKFTDSKLVKALPAENRRGIGGVFYMGDQPFVGTAIYFGAIVMFLAILGLILANTSVALWMFVGGLFMLSLAWGKNFFLNHIFYEYLPMFNKFRAVSMALGPAQFCFAVLAALGLQAFLTGDKTAEQKKRALYIAAGTTIGLCLLAMMFGGTSGPNDEKVFGSQAQLLKLLQADRAALVSSDAYRSIGFIAVAAGLLFVFLRGGLKMSIVALSVAFLALADHWFVASRNIYTEKYTSARSLEKPKPEAFDLEIQKDKDIHYRVLDLARGSITSNGTNSFFHKSINGYHAAKLQRFQEVVDAYLDGEKLNSSLHILGMMNTKYIIAPKGNVVPNPMALGHVWFVKHVATVKNANEELAALGELNPRDTAVVQESVAADLQGPIQRDSSAKIDLVAYHPDKMQYEYSATSDQVAVFPEQYYPPSKGWKCYLNGQPYKDFTKANYMLRALRVPAGQNMKLEMRFEPQSWKTGSTIGVVASLLSILLVAAGVFFALKANKKEVQ